MSQSFETSLLNASKKLLRPLVRLLLRSGIPLQAFFEIAKEVYVNVALNEFSLPGKKQSISRVSILTGMTRKEVQRITKSQINDDGETMKTQNRAACVVAGWVRDNDFIQDNTPALLEVDGEGANFSQLVKKYSGDMPVRAILDELVRVGAVERVDDNHVKLIARAYIPQQGDAEKLLMLGTDVADLITTIDHNISHTEQDPRFHRKVMYDNVSYDAVQKFKALSAIQSQQLIEKFDQWLSENDRDTNPELPGNDRMRTGIGIYYFEEDISEENTSEKLS